MSDFVPVAKTSELPDPGKMLVDVGERLIVLLHAVGHYYALDDICTHVHGTAPNSIFAQVRPFRCRPRNPRPLTR